MSQYGILFVYFMRAAIASFLAQMGQIVVTLSQTGIDVNQLAWSHVGELNIWVLVFGVLYAGIDSLYAKYTDSAGKADEIIEAQANTINQLRSNQ